MLLFLNEAAVGQVIGLIGQDRQGQDRQGQGRRRTTTPLCRPLCCPLCRHHRNLLSSLYRRRIQQITAWFIPLCLPLHHKRSSFRLKVEDIHRDLEPILQRTDAILAHPADAIPDHPAGAILARPAGAMSDPVEVTPQEEIIIETALTLQVAEISERVLLLLLLVDMNVKGDTVEATLQEDVITGTALIPQAEEITEHVLLPLLIVDMEGNIAKATPQEDVNIEIALTLQVEQIIEHVPRHHLIVDMEVKSDTVEVILQEDVIIETDLTLPAEQTSEHVPRRHLTVDMEGNIAEATPQEDVTIEIALILQAEQISEHVPLRHLMVDMKGNAVEVIPQEDASIETALILQVEETTEDDLHHLGNTRTGDTGVDDTAGSIHQDEDMVARNTLQKSTLVVDASTPRAGMVEGGITLLDGRTLVELMEDILETRTENTLPEAQNTPEVDTVEHIAVLPRAFPLIALQRTTFPRKGVAQNLPDPWYTRRLMVIIMHQRLRTAHPLRSIVAQPLDGARAQLRPRMQVELTTQLDLHIFPFRLNMRPIASR